ncbi:MAG TPA: hypothetical protein VFV87_19015, partial [Pirellulaceae bacterium]|nr:hypothetical protein [Pirellulaceae bacterium]
MATRKRSSAAIQNPKSKIQNRKRRGIVLLIVVSLLALFILMGVAFVIVAINYKKTAETMSLVEQRGDPSPRETELVLDQLLFDTLGRSALKYHSLLADLYSGDILQGTVTDVTTAPNGYSQSNQIFTFTFSTTGTASANPHYYAGRVLTLNYGSTGKFHSTRIVAYNPTTYQLSVEVNPGFIQPRASVAGPTTVVPDTFLINGAPFNGTGMGFDGITYNMDAVYGHSQTYNIGMLTPADQVKDLVALLPHFNGYDLQSGSLYFNASNGMGGSPQSLSLVDNGGLDEPWDAVDLHNMFLAMVMPDTATNFVTPRPVVPSFHRPELVGYWVERIMQEILVPAGYDPNTQFAQMVQIIVLPYGNDRVRLTADDPVSMTLPLAQLDRIYGIMHGCVFRPMPWDHPNFSGGNQAMGANFAQMLDALSGNSLPSPPFPGAPLNPWDVDNDNDGVPDSIWVDIGLPIITRPDGRRVKRLAAILIKDLGGRVDLNAHGTLAQLVGVNQSTTPVTSGLAMGAIVPRGMGYGPAEVDFLNLFASDTTAYQSVLLGRYESSATGDTGVNARPGAPNAAEALNIIKHHGVPNDYANLSGTPLQAFYANNPSWFASPPDVWGRGAIVIDYGGQPIWSYTGTVGEATDTPYELTLNGFPSAFDSPYTVPELEQLWRYHDRDIAQLRTSGLPPYLTSRLLSYLDSTNTSVFAADFPGSPGAPYQFRREAIGMNSHIPTPSHLPPPEIRTSLTVGSSTILDLYRWRLNNGTPSPPANIDEEMQRIVPWEFFKGQKFDINRWLGDGTDGYDGDGDGAKEIPGSLNAIRDDMFEATQNEWAWEIGPANYTSPRVLAQHTNSVDVDQNGVANRFDNAYARQLYARHL